MSKGKRDFKKHGVRGGFYVDYPPNDAVCTQLVCICGYETLLCRNWEDAGEDFDLHLAQEDAAKLAVESGKEPTDVQE